MGDPIVSTNAPDTTTRQIVVGSLALAALIAGVGSYLQALTVVQAADGHGLVTYFKPALADLVITSGSANILYAVRNGLRWPPFSVVAVALGILVTCAANVEAGSPHAIPPWLVNGWVAVAFLLSLDSLFSAFRERTGKTPDEPTETSAACPHAIPETLDEAVVIAADHSRDCLRVDVSLREMGRRFGLDHRKVGDLIRAAREAGAPEPTARTEQTAVLPA